MRALVQCVSEAQVTVDGAVVGSIGKGYLILLGVGADDAEEQAEKLWRKVSRMRVFEDAQGKTNLSLADVGGEVLVVSQFTLYADLKSRRPGFTKAAPPAVAIPLYEKFMACCRDRGFHVEHGAFGADMAVSSVNDGPVTLCIEL